jgi:hypothetical protein
MLYSSLSMLTLLATKGFCTISAILNCVLPSLSWRNKVYFSNVIDRRDLRIFFLSGARVEVPQHSRQRTLIESICGD